MHPLPQQHGKWRRRSSAARKPVFMTTSGLGAGVREEELVPLRGASVHVAGGESVDANKAEAAKIAA
jgi:hypothetical protein